MKTLPCKIASLLLPGLVIFQGSRTLAQSTAFTYQGRLNAGAAPANGVYDLTFTLFQYDAGGAPILGPITNLAVWVSNGVFTTQLDFGPFDPDAYSRGRWLEIAIGTNGVGSLTILSPRQPMTPAPSAIYATYAKNPSPGGGFSADLLDGLDASAFWKLGGNAGTTPGTHFLGTPDNQPVEVKVNGQRALRLEPNISSPNVIGGYYENVVSNGFFGGVIGGGGEYLRPNLVGNDHATVVGGMANTASGFASTAMGGGVIASGAYSTAKNYYTRATGSASAAMGSLTTASGNNSTAMGAGTTASGVVSTAIGNNTTASGHSSTAMGNSTTASGDNSTATGKSTAANGNFSAASGYRAKALHEGSFVWADSQDTDFASSASNQFCVRASGGARFQGGDNWDVNNTEGDLRIGSDAMRFKIGVAQSGGGAGDVWMRAHGGTGRVFLKTPGGTSIFSNEAQSTGVSLASGGGSWTSVSDRNAKENFAPVNAPEVLEKVAALPVQTWNYKSQNASTRHIGPMAQDFKASFGVGETDTGITSVDADGVALAAIQGLNEKIELEKQKAETRINRLQAENLELKQRVSQLEQLVFGK